MEGTQLFYFALVGRMTASIPEDFLEQHGIEDEDDFAERISVQIERRTMRQKTIDATRPPIAAKVSTAKTY